MLSQTAEYALRAVLFIAERENGPIRVGDVAEGLGIPQNYLSKILHTLARSGVLNSTRGVHGGFQLAVPADELSLFTVVTPFDQLDQRRQCLLGRSQCSDRTACAAHHRWKEVADAVSDFFNTTTVADLIGDGGRLTALTRGSARGRKS